MYFFIIYFFIVTFIFYQYKAGAPYREGSELSLKKAKREQTEEEAGSHRGLSILPTHQFGPQSLDPVARAPHDPRPSR